GALSSTGGVDTVSVRGSSAVGSIVGGSGSAGALACSMGGVLALSVDIVGAATGGVITGVSAGFTSGFDGMDLI
ncbi:MAG: hypothetical protein NTV00_04805, partial [Methylococcales bacterium]|nr:hypothetical protein [Methylococcales bacterium]